MGATEEMMDEKMMNEYDFNKHINSIHISWMESIIFKNTGKTKLHKDNFLGNSFIFAMLLLQSMCCYCRYSVCASIPAF